MTYPIKNIKTVLQKARQIRKEEEKTDKLLKAYWEAVSPSNYAPFIERGITCGYMQAIRDMHGDDVHSDVSYWLYDVQNMTKWGDNKPVECTGVSGKKYDARKLGEYVKFLSDNK